VPAVSSETIHTGSQQKLSAGIVRRAEKFVDIAASITHVNPDYATGPAVAGHSSALYTCAGTQKSFI
jgi:hypothetical protein